MSRLVLVDVTPQSGRRLADLPESDRGAVGLLADAGPYRSFEDLLDRVAAAVPDRSRASLTPGVWHNSVRDPDGTWRWRADRAAPGGRWRPRDHVHLWAGVPTITVPVRLVAASRSRFTPAEDVQEFRRRLPGLQITVIDTAAHAVQTARPAAVAAVLRAELDAVTDEDRAAPEP